MLDRNKGFLFAFISSICFGLTPLFGKIFVNRFNPLFVALVLTGIVGLYFGTIVFLRKDLFRNFFHKEIKWVVLLGIFAAIGSIFAFFGLTLGKATSAGFLFQFETFFASVLALFLLKEKLGVMQTRGLVVMFIGAYIFNTSFSYSFEIGNLLFLAAAFMWGANDVIVKSKIKHFSPFFLAFGRNFFSFIILFPIALSYISDSLQKIGVWDVFYFLLYGVVVAGTILLLYIALRFIKIAEATSFQLLSPIITAVLAFFIFTEHLSVFQFIGVSFILVGLLLMKRTP